MDKSVKIQPHASTKLSANDRIVIPAGIRDALGIQQGESLDMDVEDGVLPIEPYRARMRCIQKEFAYLVPPGRGISDEPIAERRQEALLEQENFERARQLRRIRDGYQTMESVSREDPHKTDGGPETQVA